MKNQPLVGDIHIHTNYSDGVLSPERIIGLAQSRRLNVISITDHDTMDGAKYCIKNYSDSGVTVVSGIELTVHDFEKIHLLGYQIDTESKILNEYLEAMKHHNFVILKRLIRSLIRKNNKITAQSLLLEKNTDVKKLSQHLVNQGYFPSVSNVLEEFYGQHGTQSSFHILNMKEGIKLILQAGGIPVLAHPGRVHLNDEQMLEWIAECKKSGLEGLECYNPCHTQEQVVFFTSMAKKLNMIVTAGSDFHNYSDKVPCEYVVPDLEDYCVRYPFIDALPYKSIY
jgi:predicted metal-dependent phosphoesterase TrpH